MANINAAGSAQAQLNRANPAAADAKLGDVIVELIAEVNRLGTQVALLTTRHNSAMTKLDADGGVTDTNYNATQAATAFTAAALKDIESR